MNQAIVNNQPSFFLFYPSNLTIISDLSKLHVDHRHLQAPYLSRAWTNGRAIFPPLVCLAVQTAVHAGNGPHSGDVWHTGYHHCQ